MVAEGPDGPVTFAFRVVGVEFEVESSQHFLVVQRTARLAGSIHREAAYEVLRGMPLGSPTPTLL